jgi:hypothetical protein
MMVYAVILATWKVEIRGIVVASQQEQNVIKVPISVSKPSMVAHASDPGYMGSLR